MQGWGVEGSPLLAQAEAWDQRALSGVPECALPTASPQVDTGSLLSVTKTG